jgi:protein-L-isoaspartate(D-aspartate) O-methyltransferase
MPKEETLSSLILRGYLRSGRVIEAMRAVPREDFVPPGARKYAWEDHPLPIGFGQTISAPHMYAIMLEAAQIREGDRVLEVGAGSGYGAALLSFLAGKKGRVVSVELVPELAKFADANVRKAGLEAEVVAGDGAAGHGKGAPYDRILVTAACGKVPPALVAQLKRGGRMLVPVGSIFQELMLIEKTGAGEKVTPLLPVQFVPLLSPGI